LAVCGSSSRDHGSSPPRVGADPGPAGATRDGVARGASRTKRKTDRREEKSEVTGSRFSQLVQKEVEYADPYEDRGLSVAIVAAGVLVGLFFIAHQTRSTGFFTATFGTLEMLLLYGTLLYWIATSALIIVGQKDLSRDLDLGGLFFAAGAVGWLWLVFPFDFAYSADALPDSVRFLVQWPSNDIARVLIVLSFIVHLGLAVFSAILRVSVYRMRAHASHLDPGTAAAGAQGRGPAGRMAVCSTRSWRRGRRLG
jgi:hypothetical protein